ncbi:MAG: GIY-YIG nuclease family protein [Parcubacteria group bacterium]|nr:GIY-YIG nuclease family protein [Parcubacteria group bacterium]
MEGFVYIIRSLKSGHFYVGSTKNVQNRVIEHNLGKTRSTKYRTPWQLVFYKKYDDINKAKRIEYKLKKAKSRKIIERIIRDRDIKMGP